MKIIINIIKLRFLYIYFLSLSLIIFFFSTGKLEANSFDISKIEISTPFEIKFDKNNVIDEGFKEAFLELISLITKSSDKNKVDKVKLAEIKGMIESFSIEEEKFINDIYHLTLGVSFNKKKVFNFLEKNNIFPSIPNKKKFLFIPIIIDENKKDLLIFSNNNIFDQWNDDIESFHLIEYILPTEDLEDLNLIKSKYENIEQYDFKEITDKYLLNQSIITLIFKKGNDIRVLSRISIGDDVKLKNQSFLDVNIKDKIQSNVIINKLKNVYEDFWKNSNQINTSIRLPLIIKLDNSDDLKVSQFEKTLNEIDLIYDFYVFKFDKNFIYYEIIFNGTPNVFLKYMSQNNFDFDTQNKMWTLE